MFTQEEKDILLSLLSQVTFKVGQSDMARKYEELVKKLQIKEQPAVKE